MTIAAYTLEGRKEHYEALGSKGRGQPKVRNLNQVQREHSTFSQRLADRVAAIGGSWGFIISFAVGLVVWCAVNTIMMGEKAFDPYPYIFLNLILSMLAAIQAPIIMMSQNRAAERDRHAAELDYDINVKAEHEIVGIHSRMDHEIIGLHLKIDALLRAQGMDPETLIAELSPKG
jgi:uncharacterized membrane protein